jgi:mannose-1-phosphate guanylyltransferase/mannose-6-phosphate isomerase
VPVILAGGQGRRLWPLTGTARPKPLLRLLSRRSLLQEAVQRVSVFSDPLVVTHHAYAQRILDHLVAIDGKISRIICEPAARSTAMAIAVASFMLERSSQVMMVMPSDHFIEDDAVFRSCAAAAALAAADNHLVILGAVPRSVETRYGYIRTSGQAEGTYSVKSFTEKPPYDTAFVLAKTPGCFWNTGIFLVRPSVFLAMIRNFAPAVYLCAREAFEKRTEDEPFIFPGFDAYARAPAVSIDRAVMEKYGDARLIPLQTGWSDIGCWSGLLGVKMRKVQAFFEVKEL